MSVAMAPHDQAAEAFQAVFGKQPALVRSAPGRVNLIGEHTDYNDGFVLPAAINFHTAIAASPRSDRTITIVADNENRQQVSVSLDEPAQFDTAKPWSNYLRGVIQELRAAGYLLTGAELAISGNVPLGAGLSSSAALEIAAIAALTELSGESITADSAAVIGQRAENNFVGMTCGIMDQLISAAGRSDEALLIDCRSLEQTFVPLPQGYELLVINSNVRRELVDGRYQSRRLQCETAAKHLGAAALRDVDLSALEAERSTLDDIVFRRARHVISENQRTLDLAQALTAHDTQPISPLMAQSHASMRDDFEITITEIDGLVAMVTEVIGLQGGVRMTGGGFGGSVIALLPEHLVKPTIATVNQHYPKLSGHAASVFVCQASNGAFVNAL